MALFSTTSRSWGDTCFERGGGGLAIGGGPRGEQHARAAHAADDVNVAGAVGEGEEFAASLAGGGDEGLVTIQGLQRQL